MLLSILLVWLCAGEQKNIKDLKRKNPPPPPLPKATAEVEGSPGRISSNKVFKKMKKGQRKRIFLPPLLEAHSSFFSHNHFRSSLVVILGSLLVSNSTLTHRLSEEKNVVTSKVLLYLLL